LAEKKGIVVIIAAALAVAGIVPANASAHKDYVGA
jgi:hypothetical protein